MALAFLSLKSVRKEKVASESLFDQRKRRMGQRIMVNTNGVGGGKDAAGTMGKQWQQRDEIYHQEMVPLKDTVGQESFEDENDEEIAFVPGMGLEDILEEEEEQGRDSGTGMKK